MNLILIRHGESQNNVILHDNPTISREQFKLVKKDNPLLTSKGCVQAIRTGRFLNDSLIGKSVDIYTSTLQRAIDTATYTIPQIERHIALDTLNEWDKHTETIEDVQERVEKFLDVLWNISSEEREDHVIVVFGHSLYFSLLLSRIISGKPSTNLAIEFPNCSISNLRFDNAKQHIAVYQLCRTIHLGKYATAVHTIY